MHSTSLLLYGVQYSVLRTACAQFNWPVHEAPRKNAIINLRSIGRVISLPTLQATHASFSRSPIAEKAGQPVKLFDADGPMTWGEVIEGP